MYVIEVPTLDLQTIVRSGQGFGWKRLPGTNMKKYLVQFGEHAAKVEQFDNRLCIGCNDDDFYNVWYPYFDLSTDYQELRSKAVRIGGEVRNWAMRYSGLHCLKMPLYEACIASCLWRNCSYYWARCMFSTLCEQIGENDSIRIQGIGKYEFKKIPGVLDLLSNGDVILHVCGREIGGWLLELLEGMFDGWLDFGFLQKLPYKNAVDYLAPFMGANEAARALMWAGWDDAKPVTVDYDTLAVWDYACESIEDFEEWYLHGFSKNSYLQHLRVLDRRSKDEKEWDWLTT